VTVPSRRIRATLRLETREPYDPDGVLTVLGRRVVAGVETWRDGVYSRTLRLDSGVVTIALSAARDAPAVECDALVHDTSELPSIAARVRRLLDLDADSATIDAALGADPALAASVARTPGVRVPGTVDPEETVVRTIIGQQISVEAARTALDRLVHELGGRVADASDGEPDRTFPSSAVIAEHGREVLRGPARRIETIVATAAAMSTGELVVDASLSRDDLDRRLLGRSGIGPWTAGYLAMRALGDPDVLLTGDLALRQGAARLGLPAEARELAARGRSWEPWRSYAGMHLWRAA
jgi:AraC family transcriptional regulator of adaptative response / DNA-3-methyladenine glycosylase II